ncbi:YecH family metal-binding protein [Enterovibrio calviensis]|uniref:YecH family metal-binding protein n=1 Tax=Enterovibrio calviensis TaxID=91359 RepID=UPI00047FA377|nr:YecH family metal-binding protein [Enterovibrio calviensis]
MSASIHVHEVLNYLKAQSVSEQALVDWVSGQWGTSARFHTCSQNGLSLSEVLVFLRRRKKILEQAGSLVVNEASICQH